MNKKVTREAEVPGDFVHMIIGSAGSNIKKIQKHYNVKMLFLGQNHDNYLERKLQITGWEVNVENAQHVVENICKRNIEWNDVTKHTSSSNHFQRGRDASNNTDEDIEITDTFLIPSLNFSRVIGLNCANLKMIKRVHKLKAVEAEDSVRVSENGSDMQSIILHGSPDNIENAKNSRNYSNNGGQISSRNFDYRSNKMANHSKTSSHRSSSEDELTSDEEEYEQAKQPNKILHTAISAGSNHSSVLQQACICSSSNAIRPSTKTSSSFMASSSLESNITSNVVVGAILSQRNFSKTDLFDEIRKITRKYEEDIEKLVEDYIARFNPNSDFEDVNPNQNGLEEE